MPGLQCLSELIADSRLFQRCFVERSFVEHVVARALHDGNGSRMLTSLREPGFERIAAPLPIALDGGAEKIVSVGPEVRTAAYRLFERLQAAKAGTATTTSPFASSATAAGSTARKACRATT